MKGYLKLTAALAAFALLLVVMGLSTQGAVNAQAPDARTLTVTAGSNESQEVGGTATAVSSTYLCSRITGAGACTKDNDDISTIAVTGTETADITITNLDLARVTDKINEADGLVLDDDPETATMDGSDANPKKITLQSGQTITVRAVHKSSGLQDGRDNRDGRERAAGDLADADEANYFEVKAFHGNRIQITFQPTGELGTSKQLNVDNVAPSVVANAPSNDLVVKENTSVTFSADVTDSGAGFKAKAADVIKSNVLDASAASPDLSSVKGRIQLVVGQYPVVLGEGDFTAIDDGWRVSKALNSSDIQGLGEKVPFYFSVEDLAGNSKQSSGNTSGKTSAAGADTGTTLVAEDYANAGYNDDAFNSRSIRYNTKSFTVPNADIPASSQIDHDDDSETTEITFTRGTGDGTAQSATVTTGITDFDSNAGTFTVAAFMASVRVNGTIPDQDTDDGEVDDDTTTDVNEADTDPFTATIPIVRAIPSGTTFDILSTQSMTVDGDAPDLGTPKAVTGHAWGGSPAKHLVGKSAKKNSIQVSFIDKGGLATDSVVPGAFGVTGNTVVSTLVIDTRGKSLATGEDKEANSFLVFLTLDENLGSDERPTITINSGVIKDRAGNAFGGDTVRADDRLGPNLSLSKTGELSNEDISITVTTDEQLSSAPTIWISKVGDRAGAVTRMDDDIVGSVTPLTATSYRTKADAGELGSGEYNVYAEGTDTQHTGNTGKVGNSSKANTSSSFTFELDNELNGGDLPVVKIANVTAATGTDEAPTVEQVDPLTVTVEFLGERNEYTRDSYRKVTVTSAELKIDFANGTSETKDFNLTTEVRSNDQVQYTIGLPSPKIGVYTLTVNAMDESGNNRLDGTGTTAEDLVSRWEVIAAQPVDIAMEVGWNLISLPFQPGSPHINSVIPATHPADIVMTYVNETKVWLVSRRDAETGQFVGDISVMTASTAYFVRSTNFQPIELLRPAVATGASVPPIPSNIPVSKGWNLVPVVSIEAPIPVGLAADDYFGSLSTGQEAGWLRALTFRPLSRTWDAVSPGQTDTVKVGQTNPCTGRPVNEDAEGAATTNVEDGTEPCQAAAYSERSTADGADDGAVGAFDENDTVAIRVPVLIGKGYWIWVTNPDGEIIP